MTRAAICTALLLLASAAACSACSAQGIPPEDYVVIEARADAGPCYPREGHDLVTCEYMCKRDLKDPVRQTACIYACQCVDADE